MALGVMTYARERDIDIPNELSVTGFDGIDAAQRLGLTTIIQPNKAKGAAAGHMLSNLIAAADNAAAAVPAVSRRVLRTNFAAGRTVAPPR